MVVVMKKRVAYCDALRLIAIICVILIHIFAIYRDYYLNVNRVYYTLVTFLDSFTRTAVPLFFMLTGAFMLSDKKDLRYKDYLKKRIPKLLIPYLVFSLIYYLYEMNFNFAKFNFKELAIQITAPYGTKYHLWFMPVMIMIYLLIPFLKKEINSLTRENIKTLIILIFLFGNLFNTINVITSLYNFPILKGFTFPELIIYCNYLFLGYYLYKFEIKKRKKIYILGIVSILLMPALDFITSTTIRNDIAFNATGILAFVPAIAIFVLFKYNYQKLHIPKKLERVINKINPLVFYIYLSHLIVMYETVTILNRIISPTRFIGNFIIILICAIIIPVISCLIAIICNAIYNSCEKVITRIIMKSH